VIKLAFSFAHSRFRRFFCYGFIGKNVNPQLDIYEIPDGAKSLVLIVDDPDAQRVVGYTWVHWVVFNIPVNGDKVVIKEDSIPGVPGESTYKKPSYGGPSPPKGTGIHNYHFKVYALNKLLPLQEGASLKNITHSMKEHIVEKAELMGMYTRD